MVSVLTRRVVAVVRRGVGRAFTAAALAGLTSACASTGATPRPFPAPGGDATPGVAASSPEAPAASPAGPVDSYALTATALALRGTPYRNGGNDPNGFDCSGFTQYVFNQYGVRLPREVKDQFQAGVVVNPEELQAGDLLFFATSGDAATHVGIAIDSDQFIHAPSSTGVVRVERLSQPYWARRFLGARRVR
jgi:cell wall-associated NlpC family hydrolase